MMVAAMGCVGEKSPDRLIGTWVATSPSHRGRSIEISEEHIVFGSDDNHSIFCTVRGVESKESQGRSTYTIEYSGGGGSSRSLSLRFSAIDPEAIELDNRVGTWVRKGEIRPEQKESI